MNEYLVYQIVIWKEIKNFLFFERNVGMIMRRVKADNKDSAIVKYKQNVDAEFSDKSCKKSKIFAKLINEIEKFE